MEHLGIIFGNFVDEMGAVTFMTWFVLGEVLNICICAFVTWKIIYFLGRNVLSDLEGMGSELSA